jgi:hypothetical protein
MESEREGRQSGAKEREMGDIVVFLGVFRCRERGRGWSLTSKKRGGEGCFRERKEERIKGREDRGSLCINF